MDPKSARYIVNGAHESSKLQDMLDGFIRKFVLCPECDNPETDLVRDLPLLVCNTIHQSCTVRDINSWPFTLLPVHRMSIPPRVRLDSPARRAATMV